MSEAVYLVGGRQKYDAKRREEWHKYREAAVVWFDLETGVVRTMATWRSPAEACPAHDPSFVFKAGHLEGDLLYACTQTEVLLYRVPEFEQVGYLSLPFFNDLHHVRPSPGGHLLVVSTGLDMLAEVTMEGEVLREWGLAETPTWERFSRAVDYRRVASTKPHLVHPNYCFLLDGQIWATRFEQRDALCLTETGRRIDIRLERPHDGVVRYGKVWFTTVDGKVVAVDLKTRRKQVYDLQAISRTENSLGWCRGLHLLSEDRVLVGFSRIRHTRIKENLRWLRDRFKDPTGLDIATRVVLVDLPGRRMVWQKSVEDGGLNAVFSIHPA